MPIKDIKAKLSFTSFASACLVETLRFVDPVGDAFDTAIRFYSPYLQKLYLTSHVARGVLEAVFLLVMGSIFYAVFDRYGIPGYGRWEKVKDAISFRFRLLLGKHKQEYGPGERAGREFQKHISRSLHDSKRIYFLLFSGYTMVYEEEKFIVEALSHLRVEELQSKDIRFLILDPTSKHWENRANDFLSSRRPHISLQDYKDLCRIAQNKLGNISGAQIHTYSNIPPLWRLHIFDDYIFVSRYSEHGDPDFQEGHRTSVIALNVETPMYHWMYSAFRSRCPDAWRILPYRLTTTV